MNPTLNYTYNESSPSSVLWGDGEGVKDHLKGKPAGSKNKTCWLFMLNIHGQRKAWTGGQIVWMLHHGPNSIPKGHVIIYKDGNVHNTKINNLMCVSRFEMRLLSSWRRNCPSVYKNHSGTYTATLCKELVGTFEVKEDAEKAHRLALWEKVKHLIEGVS